MKRLPFALALACATPLAPAADAHPASAGSLLQVLFGLVAVLALMAGAAWLMKRMGVSGAAGSNVVKVVGAASVGTRERVVVVEVADQWIVVGVAQGSVNALSTMPKQQIVAAPPGMPATNNFAGWLKQTIDKRNGNK